MSEENVRIVRRSYDAFNRRDPDAVRPDIHSDFEIDFSHSLGPARGSYAGEEGMKRLWETYWDAFESISIEPSELIESGDKVVAIVRVAGRGKGSGIDVEARGPHLWTFRDGKVFRITLYQETAEALEAAGLSG